MKVSLFASKMLSWMRTRKAYPCLRGNILDLGCGANEKLIERLAPETGYVGVDISEVIIENMKRRYPHRQFLCADICRPIEEIEGRRFDTVVMLAVIEHISEPAGLLQQCSRYLAPRGRLVVTTPTPFGEKVHGLMEKALLLNKPGRFSEAARHEVIYNRRDLLELLGQSGFIPRDYRVFELGTNQLVVASSAPATGQSSHH